MSDAGALGRRALEHFGLHPAARAGLDLQEPGDRARWLVLARLLSERAREAVVLTAFARLAASPGAEPDPLAAAGPLRVAAVLTAAGLPRADTVAPALCRAAASLCNDYRGDLDALAAQCENLAELGGRLAGLAPGLGAAGLPRAEQVAPVLCRAAASLCSRHAADLDRLAAESDGLEALGGALAALAPGLGAATVLRFLRPLRDAWTAARETPLAEPARAAAIHVGLLAESEDLEGEPAALRAACARHLPEVSPVDVEAALERLGAMACRTGRTARCPLGEACPAK